MRERGRERERGQPSADVDDGAREQAELPAELASDLRTYVRAEDIARIALVAQVQPDHLCAPGVEWWTGGRAEEEPGTIGRAREGMKRREKQ